jgi:hypothetical protein
MQPIDLIWYAVKPVTGLTISGGTLGLEPLITPLENVFKPSTIELYVSIELFRIGDVGAN